MGDRVTLSINQIDTAIRELNKLTNKVEIAKIIGVCYPTLLRHIKILKLADPIKLPKNKVVAVQILVRRKYATKAIRDFQSQANKKYKL